MIDPLNQVPVVPLKQFSFIHLVRRHYVSLVAASMVLMLFAVWFVRWQMIIETESWRFRVELGRLLTSGFKTINPAWSCELPTAKSTGFLALRLSNIQISYNNKPIILANANADLKIFPDILWGRSSLSIDGDVIGGGTFKAYLTISLWQFYRIMTEYVFPYPTTFNASVAKIRSATLRNLWPGLSENSRLQLQEGRLWGSALYNPQTKKIDASLTLQKSTWRIPLINRQTIKWKNTHAKLNINLNEATFAAPFTLNLPFGRVIFEGAVNWQASDAADLKLKAVVKASNLGRSIILRLIGCQGEPQGNEFRIIGNVLNPKCI